MKRILLFLIAGCTTFFSKSQIIGLHSYAINEDGTSPKITALYKHSLGYFLVGTSSGLYRFDGSRFTSYNFIDSVANKTISAIEEDKDHTVWLGMKSGEIALLQDRKIRFLKAEEGHPSVAITCIKCEVSGTVYFATAGEGIYYYVNKRFYNVNSDDGLSDNYVYDLLLSRAGVICSTDRGLNVVNVKGSKKSIQSYTSVNGLPDNIVRCLRNKPASPSDGIASCWFGMQDKGIGTLSINSNNAFQGKSLNTSWSFGQVNSIIAQNKQLWAATEDKGIVVMNYRDSLMNILQSTSTYNEDFTKAGNFIRDHEGNTWLTSNNKLVRTSGTQLQNILPFNTEQFAAIHTILSDHMGNIWVNVNNGLEKFFFNQLSGKWEGKKFALPGINEKTDITSLYEDQFGNIWAGTMGKGIMITNPFTGKSRNLSENNLLVDGSVLSINGKGNEVWISSLGGAVNCTLSDLNRDISQRYVFNNFSKVSGIGSNYIYSIMVDSRNRVWFATDGKGLTVYDKGTYHNYGKNEGIKSLVIYSMVEDNKGNIWFSTATAGVYKFDGKRFTNFSVNEGLNDATITALSIDGKGNIVALSKKALNIIDTKTNAVTYFDTNQGLDRLNTDLNCITSNGTDVYVVSNKGIIRYSACYESTVPKLVIDQVQLFLNTINTTEKTKFAYDENNFSFSFSGISFSHPEKIRYQYKLEGFSNEWINTKDNSVNFPKLPPGSYTFRVRVSLNNNFNNSREASYPFTINKPLWMQWWMIALLTMTALAAIFYLFDQREKRVKRWERMQKEKIQSQFETLKSQVNPHFLFNSFNTLISVIEENPANAVEYVEHLSDLYRKIVTYRDKDVITLKEELALINDYFFIQKKRFGNHLQLGNKISNEQASATLIAPLTLQLLAENAVKHNAISGETPLVIQLSIRENLLVIENNINPKHSPEKGEGMGLQNIQNRYLLLSKVPVNIVHTESAFIVYIPILSEK